MYSNFSAVTYTYQHTGWTTFINVNIYLFHA